MWKKYKFEWKFLSSAVAGVIQQTGGKSIKLSDFLGVARTTPAGKRRCKKSRDGESNPGPTAYEAVALPAELSRHK